MKLDPRTEFHHSNSSHEYNIKPVDLSDGDVNSDGLGSRFFTMKGSQNGNMCNQNGCERDAHGSPSDQCVPVDSLANGKGEGERELVPSFAHPTGEIKSSENESDRYFMDKSVRECELPEVIVCYRECNEHVVKDICVDVGVPCRDKIFFENNVDECQSDGSCPHSQTEENTDSVQEELGTALLYGEKVSERNEFDKDSATMCSSKVLVNSGEPNSEATNIIEDDVKSYSVCRHSLAEEKCDLVRNGMSSPHGQTVSERNDIKKDSTPSCSSKDLEKSVESKGDETKMIADDGSNGSVVDGYKFDRAWPKYLTEQKRELVEKESGTGVSLLDDQTASEREELEKDSAILCSSKDLMKSGKPEDNMHEKSEESILDDYECDNASQHSSTAQKSEFVKEELPSGNSFSDGPMVIRRKELDNNSTVLCSSKNMVKLVESNGEKTNLTEDDLSHEVLANNCDRPCPHREMEHKTDLEEKESYTGILIPDELTFPSRNEAENDAAMLASAKGLLNSEEANNEETNRMEDDNLTPPVALSPLQESEAGSFDCKFNAYDSTETIQQSNQFSNAEAELDSSPSVSNSAEPNRSPEEAVLATSKSSTHENSRNIIVSVELSEMEECGSITFDFDSNAQVPSKRGEISQDNQPKNLESQNASETQNGASNARSILYKEENCHGESSFSMSGPSSGRISYSGAIPFSGNISVRSDGSATSARSFAFPVLQPEWNSSPARMARADRRTLEKHRRWRYYLLCCRF